MIVIKKMSTETGHRLSNYDGKCAHLHGHTYRWEVTAEATTLTNGMVCDFADLKRVMITVIGDFDHAFILSTDDKLVDYCNQTDLNIKELLRANNGDDPRIIVSPWNPTAENLAKYTLDQLRAHTEYEDGFDVIKVGVWETENSYAEAKYEYAARS